MSKFNKKTIQPAPFLERLEMGFWVIMLENQIEPRRWGLGKGEDPKAMSH